MARILIPRSDSVDVKIIEPSDFESFFSSDWMNDYVKSGFTFTQRSSLTMYIAVGLARLKGLFINNSTTYTMSGLSANATNYIYVTLARDSNSEAESWSFTSNTSGTTPTDSLFIGTAITNATVVTSFDDNNIETQAITGVAEWGDGSDGNVTLSSNTALSGAKYYNNLTINAGVSVTGATPIVIFARNTVTINGTITPDRTTGGAGGGGGTGGYNTDATTATQVAPHLGVQGNSGNSGSAGYVHSNPTGSGGASGGASGSHTTGGVTNGGGSGGSGAASVGKFSSQLMTKIRTSVISNPNSNGGGGAGGSGGGGGGGGEATGNYAGSGGSGGSGGAGGGSVIIIAPTIIFNSGASILSNGLAGSNGNNGVNAPTNYVGHRRGGAGGGGGGGGGGHGGSIMFIYKSLTDSGTANITGGAAGSGGSGGAASSGATYAWLDSSAGSNAGGGATGGTGTLIKLDVS